MIRINLLPVKTSKKAEAGRQQLVLFALALVLGLGGNAYAWHLRSAEQERLSQQVQHTQDEIAKLDKVIAEVKDINKKEDELKTKLAALNSLKAGRAGPVKVLDALQTAVPKKVWLTSVGEIGGAMKIEGVALSQDDLAEFMTALQNVVDTPQGIGRLVASDNTKESRVELSADGRIMSFQVTQVSPFFTNVQLAGDSETGENNNRVVKFTLNLSANYSA